MTEDITKLAEQLKEIEGKLSKVEEFIKTEPEKKDDGIKGEIEKLNQRLNSLPELINNSPKKFDKKFTF